MLATIKAPTTEQGDASREVGIDDTSFRHTTEVGTIWSVRIAAFLTV